MPCRRPAILLQDEWLDSEVLEDSRDDPCPEDRPSDGLRLLEHGQIVLEEADLQAERDELRIKRHLQPLVAFGGAQAREGCGLEDPPDGHLGAGPGVLIDAPHGSGAEMTLPRGRFDA
jgi:hypothetical protein